MKKNSFLLSIILILVVLIGSTMAWITLRTKRTAMVLTIGNPSNTMVTITPYQVDEVLYPVLNNIDGTMFDITVKNSSSLSRSFGLYFKINNIDSELLSSSFKYYVAGGSAVCNTNNVESCEGWHSFQNGLGDFSSALDSNRMYIFENTVAANTTYYYKVFIYIDGNNNNNDIVSASADLELRADIEETGVYTKVLLGSNDDLIYKLHHDAISEGDSATSSTIPATDDYRYYGVNPNNYVCLDYEGQNTCPDKHLYRIIGIIRNDSTGDNELRLIKANPLNHDNGVFSSAWGTNADWSSSTLNLDSLNSYYLNSTNNFSTTGLSSDAIDLLSNTLFYISGDSTVQATPNNFYLKERGTSFVSTGTDTKYIGLLYPSDYGYASETAALNNGECQYASDCYINNWMPMGESTITSAISAYQVYYITDEGQIDMKSVSILGTYNPVVSIKANVVIGGGLGTITNPYKLTINTLYNVLKLAADEGLYATRYTGSHQDDFNGTRSTKEIYHWKAMDNSAGTADANGTAITNKFNVVFADMCWQMIRTTDTGGVRLLYNGLPTTNTANGKTTYDCGTTRPGHVGGIRTTLSLSGSFKYASSYTVTGTGTNTRFTLVDSQTITVNSSNAATQIANIVANYPYTCGTTSDSCTSATNFYKVTGQSRGVTAYVYPSVQYYDNLGTSAFNSPGTSIARVGYMYNSSTLKTTSWSYMTARVLGVSTSSSYLIGDSLINNSDGTISLSGNVTEVAGSTWSSDYANYKNKFVCLPGYYNATTYVCSDTRTTNYVQAVGYITATAGTNMTYQPVYKYGNNIQLDSGTTYNLVGDGSAQNKLQYIYNWSATTTSGCFANSTYYTNGNVSSCGYKSIDYSHYTCLNLSGKCSTYYYIGYTTGSEVYTTPITGGKYVSTDITDTNNILYEMLYASNVNTTNSTIKGNIDTWYRDNLYANYDSYIDDTVYCNDRTITSFEGWNPNGGSTTSSLQFKEYTVSSDLSCTNTIDKFSQANTSAQLTYKAGLVSSPEMNLLNNNNARKAAYRYWLSSPNGFVNYNAFERLVDASGDFVSYGVSSTGGVRPSVSLNTGIGYSQGTGAMNDPYVVEAPPVNNN